MSACLGCGHPHARILHCRTFELPNGGKEQHRISVCAEVARGGCGQVRMQIVVDHGTTRRRAVPAEKCKYALHKTIA